MARPKYLRKNVSMLVTVSVPWEMTAAEARREVKTLIHYQSNYQAGVDDVRAVRVEAPGGKQVGRKPRP